MNYLHCLVKCIVVRLGLLGLFNAMSKSGIKLCVEVKSILKSKLYWRAYEVTGNDDSLELGIKSFIMWLFYEKQLCLFFTVVLFQTKTLRSQRLYYQQQKTVRKLRLKSQSFAFIKNSLKDSIQGCGDILSVTFSEQKFKPYFAASCIPLLLLSFLGWRQFANSSQELWNSDFLRHQPLTWAISDVNVFEEDQII